MRRGCSTSWTNSTLTFRPGRSSTFSARRKAIFPRWAMALMFIAVSCSPRATPQRFAAHLAISSLADHASDKGEVGDYHFHKINYIRREHGRLTLATCRVQLTQAATGRDHDLAVAAMHLGGLDFYCTLKLYPGHDSYERSVENLSTRFQIAPLPALLRLMQEEFGPDEYGLDDVLADGRWAIGEMVLRGLTGDLTAQFMHMYETD